MNTNIELYEKMRRLQWLLQKQHVKAHVSGNPMADPSRGQGRILAFLRIKDGISTKDMSYMLGIRVSSLNELLGKLEKNGYITRRPAEEDKRVMLVFLTEKGRQAENGENETPDIFSCLTEEEQKTFGDYLDRMIATLEEKLDMDEEENELFSWMEMARDRMGEEQFNELLSMRGGFPGFNQRRPGRSPHHGHHGQHGRRGFSPEGRGRNREDRNPPNTPPAPPAPPEKGDDDE